MSSGPCRRRRQARADTIWLQVELDADDGRILYEVEFGTASAEYEIDLDARTGDIVKNEQELYRQPSTREQQQPSSPVAGDIGRGPAPLKSPSATRG